MDLDGNGEENVLFSSADGDLLDQSYAFVGPVGQDTAVLCSSYEGESYVFQLSKSLMVGRFMAQVEQANAV